MTVEQICRDLLEQAVKDKLVEVGIDLPHELTAGDLVGMANLLNEYLKQQAEGEETTSKT